MRCPFCGHLEDKVVDSRESREGEAIRRRRECLNCSRRFTSYERVEEVPILVAKKDGRREPFDRAKLMRGVMAACQKRPVSLARLEELVTDIQARLAEHADREIHSRELGEWVMDGLKLIDTVAYVRFASVYREFKDLTDFVKALETMVGSVKKAGIHAFARTDGPEAPPPLHTGPLLVKGPMPPALFPGEDLAPPIKPKKRAK